MKLAPFWRYYGGKNRAAKRYPAPEHNTIVEPFAGAAGYSCHYPDRQIILIDQNPIICGIWRYLISASASEIRALPDIPANGTVDDLNVCQEIKWLAGFWCNSGSPIPWKSPSKHAKYDMACDWVGGWSQLTRERLASQVDHIRHWKVIQGDYTRAPNIVATWFIDPPYDNRHGRRYPSQPASHADLGKWCQTQKGLVIVCENDGAKWLPFKPFGTIQNAKKNGSNEVIWLNKSPKHWQGVQTSIKWSVNND